MDTAGCCSSPLPLPLFSISCFFVQWVLLCSKAYQKHNEFIKEKIDDDGDQGEEEEWHITIVT